MRNTLRRWLMTAAVLGSLTGSAIVIATPDWCRVESEFLRWLMNCPCQGSDTESGGGGCSGAGD